ncbi:hypothetical protein, partial [Sulfurimonas sp.]
KGIFGYEPKITYLFGLPRTISSGGIHLDIEYTTVGRALNNDNQKTIDYAIQTGPIGSALEHQVPEQMFNTDPNNPTQAISTVKALQLANQQGQQIYKIDQTNIDTVLPKLNLSNTIKQDIQSSVNAGKYVITHTDNVSVPGWSGAGYAIIDPTTGSDAYMISGGENGGQYTPEDSFMIMMLSILSAQYDILLEILKKAPSVISGFLAPILNSIAQMIDIISILQSCKTRGIGLALAMIAAVTINTFIFVTTLLIFLSPAGAIGAIAFAGLAGILLGIVAKSLLVDSLCKN